METYKFKTMTPTQQARIELAINTASVWSEFLKTENDRINKLIFEEENFHQRMAIESGGKASLVNCAINEMENILSLLKEIQNEK